MAKKKREILKVHVHDRRAAGRSKSEGGRRRVLNVKLLIATAAIVIVAGGSLHFWRGYQVRRQGESVLASAEKLAKDGKTKEAARQVKVYAGLAGTNISALERMAALLEQQPNKSKDDSRRLARLHAEVLALDATRTDHRAKLARLHLDLGSNERAIDESKKWIAARPNEAAAHRVQADALYSLKRFPDAQAAYQKTIELEPKDVVAYARLANCYLQNHAPQKAKQTIADMVAKNPESGEAYFRRCLYRRSVLKEDAVDDLDKAAELEPKNLSILLAAGGQSLADRRWSHAERYYGSAVKSASPGDPSLAAAYLGLGNAQYSMEKKNEAVATWKAALDKVGSGNLQVNLRLSEALVEIGQLDDAKTRLDRLRQKLRAFSSEKGRDPADVVAVTQVVDWLEARFWLQRDDVTRAVGLLESAARSELANVSITFSALELLGGLATQRQQWDQAAEYFQKAAILRPDAVGNRAALGEALIRAGRADDAITALSPLSGDAKLPTTVAVEIARAQLRKATAQDAKERNWSAFEASLADCRNRKAPAIDVVLLESGRLLAEGKYNEARQALIGAEFAQLWNVALEARWSLGRRLALSALPLARGKFPAVGQTFAADWVRKQRVHDIVRLWVGFAEIAESSGDSAAAERMLRTASTLFPRSARLAMATASLLSARDPKTAVELLDQAYANAEPAERNAILRYQASVALRLADRQAVIAVLRKVVQHSQRDFDSRFDLCQQLLRINDFAGADQVIDDLKKIEGENGTLWRAARVSRLLSPAANKDERPAEDILLQADALLAEIAQRRPQWERTHVLAGTLAIVRGDENKAIGEFEKSVRCGNAAPEVQRQLLSLLIQKGDMRTADAYIARWRKQVTRNADLLPLAMQVSLDKGRPVEAETLARQALADRPNDPASHLLLAQVMTASGKKAEAEKCYRDAVALNPRALSPKMALLRHLAMQGSQKDAETALADIVANADLGAKPELVLGFCHSMVKQTETAKKYYQKAIEQYPDDPAVLRLASTFFLAQGLPEADETVKKLQARQPDDPGARRARAFQLLDRQNAGQWQEGLDLLANQDATPDLRLRSMLLERMGGPDNHREAVRILEEVANRPADGTAADRLRLAQLYAVDGRIELALAQVAKLTANPQCEAAALAHYVDFSLQLHRRSDEAGSCLERLEKARPDDFASVVLRARWFQAGGDEAAAFERIEQFLNTKRASPKWPDHLRAAAEACAAMNLADKADAYYQQLAATGPRGLEAWIVFLMGRGEAARAVNACLERLPAAKGAERTAFLVLAAHAVQGDGVAPEALNNVSQLLADELAQQPGSFPLVRSLAGLRLSQGAYAESIERYRECSKQQPDDIVVLNNLAIALSKSGSHDEARETIGKAIKTAGPKLELLDTKGLILLEAGNLSGAVAVFDQVTADPRSTAVHALHLAYACSRANRPNETRLAVERYRQRRLDVRQLSEDDRKMLAHLDAYVDA